MTTDSPINYPCPTCLRPRGELCIRPLEAQDIVFFHMGRRAVRMAALARSSARTVRRPSYCATQYEPPIDRVYTTRVRRPDPQLPFDEPCSARERWEREVKRAVDMIFETMEAER